MSRTYVGPFGRILPILDDSSSQGSEEQSSVADETPSRMAMYQLPRPSIPSRLQFGSDTLGFTEPTRYENMNRSRGSLEPSRRTHHEQLPPVSTLLTPHSQSSIPPSPFSSQYSPDSSELRSSQPSPHRSSIPDRQTQSGVYHIPGGYANQPQPQYADYVLPKREELESISSAQQFSNHYSVPPESTTTQYAIYSEPPRQASYPQQHSPNTPTDPSQYYYGHAPGYGPQSNVTTDSVYATQDTPNPIKTLHRVIGEAVFPGEGPCWLYEDGSRCKKVIDGEMVNAQWGVTKQGKPRKRLAIACTTCREKKIKCDPGDPKCVQCDKFGRECRFQTAPRGQHMSPETPSYEHQAQTPSSIGTQAAPPSLASQHSFLEHDEVDQKFSVQYSPPVETIPSDQCYHDRPSPPRSKSSVKRQRQKSPKVLPTPTESDERRPESMISPAESDLASAPAWSEAPAKPDSLSFALGDDPYDVDPIATSHYMEMYFTHVNAATYCMFPRGPFLHWMRKAKDKSTDNLMIIYAMLAMGSIFSSRDEGKAEGCLFSKLARYAVEKNQGNYTLQLVQSRAILALYHFAKGDAHQAWDFCGMAVRAASGLKLNLEEGITDIQDDEEMDYGLTRNGLVECHRRTFWSVYLMDRYNGFCSGHLCLVHNEDTFARLPSREKIYENQEKVKTPYFDNGIIDPDLSQDSDPSTLGPMAYLARISSIWGDVLAYIYRSVHQSPASYRAHYEDFYNKTHRRLSSWMSILPSHLTYDTYNTDASIRNGYIGTYISIHALYYTTIMKMNRHVRHSLMPLHIINRNLQEASRHASQFLQIMRTLSKVDREARLLSTDSQPRKQQIEFAFSTPFTGYAILSAIDILSAGGSLEQKSLTETLRLMNGGLVVVEELSQFWASARGQRKAITRRIDELASATLGMEAARMKGWVNEVPMERIFGYQLDALYVDDETKRGLNRKMLFTALEVQARPEETMVLKDGDVSGGLRGKETDGYSRIL